MLLYTSFLGKISDLAAPEPVAPPGWWLDPAFDIERASFTDAGNSDEFDVASLGAQWTPVNCSAGTVDLLGTPASGVYDLSTIPGMILFQPTGNVEMGIRLDAIPADGEQHIASLYRGGADGRFDVRRIGLMVNNDDADPSGTAPFSRLDADENRDTFSDILFSTNQTTDLRAEDSETHPETYYFRIVNDGGTIYFMFSFSGTTWRIMGNHPANEVSNVFITCLQEETSVISMPIYGCRWFRHTAFNGYDAF